MTRRLFLLAILFCLYTGLSLADTRHTGSTTNKALLAAEKKKAENTKNKINQILSLKKSLDQDQSAMSRAELRLKAIELHLNTQGRSLSNLTADIQKEQDQISQLQAVHAQYTGSLNQQHTALQQQLRLMYHIGQPQAVKTVLNADNITDLHRHLTYVQDVSTQRSQLANNMKQNLHQLKLNMDVARAHEVHLKTLLQRKQIELANLASMQVEHQHIVMHLQETTQYKQNQLHRLLINQAALGAMLSELKNADHYNGPKTFQQLQGKLLWPVPGRVHSPVTESTEVNQHIAGVIIDTPNSTPVHAVADGTVIFADWLRGYGLLIIVSHGDNYLSLYARNQTLLAKVGDTIKAHAVIATSGNTGGYQDPGLYFEIRRNSTAVDPREWCV